MSVRARTLAVMAISAFSVAAMAVDISLTRESWSEGSDAGWTEVDASGGMTVGSGDAPDGAALRGAYGSRKVPTPEPDGFVCGAGSSGGLFTGDLTAKGYVPLEVGFDCMAEGALPSFCCIRMSGTNATFFAPVTAQIVSTGEWSRVTASLAYDSAVWHGGSGSAFSNALKDVRDFQIGLVRGGNEAQTLVVDNFSVVCRVPAGSEEVDTDGDGLPDYWELAWFGGVTNGIATVDSDGDGLSNGEEYVCGTDPTDGDAVLGLERPDAGGGVVLVRYLTVPARRYRVLVHEGATGDPGAWSAMTPWVAGHGGYRTAAHTNAPTASWYKLRARRQ